jgi:hypothetical protein
MNKFCVQSKDFYYLPFREADALQMDRQFLELLVEVAPELRCGLYDTIEDALRAHETTFGSVDLDLKSSRE